MNILNKKSRIIFYLIVFSVFIVWVGFILISFFYYNNKKLTDESFFKEKDLNIIEFTKIREEKKFDVVFSDLKLLTNLPIFKQFLSNSNLENKKKVQELFYQFSLRRGVYDQIRFLDNNGQEVIRVNYDAGKPKIVEDKNLQNKKGRYYFDEAIKLGKEFIYISPLDLNIEQNKIEEPYKPMIRIATPVFDGGDKKGIVVFNYLAKDIINDLNFYLSRDKQGEVDFIEMLNKDGYWLNSINIKNEWGFMFEDKKDLTMAIQNPELWKTINQEDSGQVLMKDGLYTFSTLSTASNQAEEWKIYHFTGKDIIYKESNSIKSLLYIINIVFTFILLSILFGVYIFLKRLNKEINLTKQSEEKFKAFSSSVKDAVVIMDDKGRVVFWNKTAEKMFGYTEKEILGKEFHHFIVTRKEYLDNANILKFGETGESKVLGKLIELPVKNKEGKEFFVELSVSAILINDVWNAIGIMRDISERKEIENTILESKKQTEKALEESSRLNNLMVNRELEMIKLKNEIAKLKEGR